jgi:hypothetical protein
VGRRVPARDVPIDFRRAPGHRRGGSHEFGQADWQRADADHAAALRSRSLVSAGGRRKPVICGLFAGTLHVAMVSGFSMIAVIMAFMVDMLRAAYSRFVNMHEAKPAKPPVGWYSRVPPPKSLAAQRWRVPVSLDDIATKCSISWVCRPTEPRPRATRPVHRLNVRAVEGRRSASPDPGLPGGRSAPPSR